MCRITNSSSSSICSPLTYVPSPFPSHTYHPPHPFFYRYISTLFEKGKEEQLRNRFLKNKNKKRFGVSDTCSSREEQAVALDEEKIRHNQLSILLQQCANSTPYVLILLISLILIELWALCHAIAILSLYLYISISLYLYISISLYVMIIIFPIESFIGEPIRLWSSFLLSNPACNIQYH